MMLQKQDRYIKTHEPVYRYHHYGDLSVFKIDLNFGTAATLDMHRTWMIALESFMVQMPPPAGNVAGGFSLMMGNVGQTDAKTNLQELVDGSTIIFPINNNMLFPIMVTSDLIGHRITNTNFLNSSIPCRIISSAEPLNPLGVILAIQFSFVVYAYDP
jgi:hypothetical protein